MNKISVEIVADSISPQGDRLISVLATFPRIILSEMNTHRMLSKNTSSSRAIPFNKMVEAVQNNPFIPIAWQREHKGMQGSEYFTNKKDIEANEKMWLHARDYAIQSAVAASRNFGITKQLCNRLLEPFMWTTMLITGSKEGWDNFFNLRCPSYLHEGSNTVYKSKKDYQNREFEDFQIPFDNDTATNIDWLQINKGQAEIHMMMLSEKIYDVIQESVPKKLKEKEWHIPFGNKILFDNGEGKQAITTFNLDNEQITTAVKISTAMAARTSYTVVGEEKDIDYQKMIELHDRLLTQDPPHSSPMEHCCLCVSEEEYNNSFKGVEKGWFRNYRGFKSYREIVESSR